MQVSFEVDGPPEFVKFLNSIDPLEFEKLFYFGWQCQESINRISFDKIRTKEYVQLREEIKTKDLLIENNSRIGKNISECFFKKQEEMASFWLKRFDELAQSSKDKKIEELETQLQTKHSSIVYKGQIGEETVREILAQNFPSFEIINKTKETNCGDFHIINLDGTFIAIECKNKHTISALDVSKSTKDILHLKKTSMEKKFAAYLFISLKTKNIPKKGDLLFECIENIPVLWFACDQKDAVENILPQLVKLLFQHHNHFENNPIQYDYIRTAIQKIAEFRKKIQRLLTPIETLRKEILDLDLMCDEIWKDLTKTFQ